MESPAIPFVVPLPSDWTFFGLTRKYKLNVADQLFDLTYHSKGAFSYTEVRDMPVYMRLYYIRKLNKLFEDRNKEQEKATKQMKTKSRSMAPKIKRR